MLLLKLTAQLAGRMARARMWLRQARLPVGGAISIELLAFRFLQTHIYHPSSPPKRRTRLDRERHNDLRSLAKPELHLTSHSSISTNRLGRLPLGEVQASCCPATPSVSHHIHIHLSVPSFKMTTADSISEFLNEQREKTPDDLVPLLLEFETLWERKLWHQLTNALAEFFDHPASAPQRLAFYKGFVFNFAHRINQLRLVDLALKAATECSGTS